MGTCWGAPSVNQSKSTTIKSPSPGKSKTGIDGSGSSSSNEILRSESPVGKILESPAVLKIYGFAELKTATRNFRPNTVLGEGGFGMVFKGWVDEKTYAPSEFGSGMAVAVRQLNREGIQGSEEWQSEVNMLGRITHPNLVKLIGHCREDQMLLLVYEFMQKGGLENHLFRGGSQPLSWSIRVKIALGAAHGLAFLHASDIIFRDFKSSSILLDQHFNAKLSDFGLTKNYDSIYDTHICARVVGTHVYAAPEYVASGQLTVKSDVYSFGVVLLEMLTGQRALDRNRPARQCNLVEWAKPLLSNQRKIKTLIDTRLNGQFPVKDAIKAAQLAQMCLVSEPMNRPSMEEVVEALKPISIILKESKTSVIKPFN